MSRYKIALIGLLATGAALAATSYTTHYLLAKPADGDVGWGTTYRANMDTIDTQMFVNQEATQDHIDETVGAHEASAISAVAGAATCQSVDNVQDFLDCLDLNFGNLVGGSVVTTNTDQEISGQKTFTATILADAGIETSSLTIAALDGILRADAGVVSSTSIVNADVASDAAIDLSKLATLSPLLALQSDADGLISASAVTATELGYVSGVTSSIQTQLNAKGVGSVTSVGLTVPGSSIYGVTGSPVTSSGSLGLTTTGTSGGIPYFSSSSVVSSSAALTSRALILGGGAGVAPTSLGSLGTTTTVLHGNAAGNPSFGAVSLTADVSGVLPVANGGSNKALTLAAGGVLYTDADSFEVTPAGSASQVLTSNGTSAPTWQAPVAGAAIYTLYNGSTTLSSSGPVRYVRVGSTGPYTITLYDCTAPLEGYVVSVKRDATSTVTVAADATDTIEGAASVALSVVGQAITAVCNGSGAWFIF